MPYTTTDIAAQFTRQFVEEDGALVYRRHGKGAAFRVTEEEAADFLDGYMRRTRLNRIALVLATVVFGGGGVLLLDASGTMPSEAALTIGTIGFLILLIGAFVWLEMRSLTLPDRALSARQTPVAAAYDNTEWSRTQLAKAPWSNFVIVAVTGFYLVWALSEEVDPMHGWGRLVWLLPLGVVLLAGVQAYRKWKLSNRR